MEINWKRDQILKWHRHFLWYSMQNHLPSSKFRPLFENAHAKKRKRIKESLRARHEIRDRWNLRLHYWKHAFIKKIPLQIRQGEQVLAPSATFVLYRNFVLITDTMWEKRHQVSHQHKCDSLGNLLYTGLIVAQESILEKTHITGYQVYCWSTIAHFTR